MALKTVLGDPDKVEVLTDKAFHPLWVRRYDYEAGDYYTKLEGYMQVEETTTTSTWTAATRQACVDYQTMYTPPMVPPPAGSRKITAGFNLTQENKVVNSWKLTLVVQDKTQTFVPEA